MKLLNQEIWLAYPKLVALTKIPLPVKTGIQIGLLTAKLQQAYIIIEGERRKLVDRFGIDNGHGEKTVDVTNPQYGDFSLKFGELLMLDWKEDIAFEKAVIPTLMAGECPHCQKTINVPFVIDPQILLPLQEKLIEVIE